MSNRNHPRQILFSLCFTTIVSQLPNILTGLLLIEIAQTFGTSIGVMGQIKTASSILGLITALAGGFLSVRYRYRTLLLSGLFLFAFSILGASLSVDYAMALAFFALLGVSLSLTGPMVNSIIGQEIQQERRPSAVGYLTASGALAYLIGSPTIAYASGQTDWRSISQFMIVPLILASLILSYFLIPSSKVDHSEPSPNFTKGYRAILRSRSSIACLVAWLFSSSIWNSYLAFSASFIRQTFQLSTIYTSISTIIGASAFILGSLSSSRFTQRMGIRKAAVLFSLSSGLLVLLYLNTPNFWITLILGYSAAFCNGVLLTTTGLLNLEQVPEFRGTMMSLSSASGSLGAALGTGIVGSLIFLSGYGVSGVYMIAVGILAALIYGKLVNESIIG